MENEPVTQEELMQIYNRLHKFVRQHTQNYSKDHVFLSIEVFPDGSGDIEFKYTPTEKVATIATYMADGELRWMNEPQEVIEQIRGL